MGADEEMKRISLVQRVRETETPGKYGAAFCYSKAVYAAFGEILALREEGFSMVAICKVMKSDGLLPKNANPYSFRRAFKREFTRREKTAKIHGGNNPIGDVNESAAPIRKHIAADNGKNAIEKTGGGAVKKLPNGSFEY